MNQEEALRRIAQYAKKFPKFPVSIWWCDNRLYWTWILGNNYQNKQEYYGSYPGNYLERLGALFPEIYTPDCLHLFSGALKKEQIGEALRLDSNPRVNPDICADFNTWTPNRLFKIICADPPYSFEDAVHYGTCMINRNVVIEKCGTMLEKGGLILWLDQTLPMWSKNDLSLDGFGGIVISSNHRFRCVTVFRKV